MSCCAHSQSTHRIHEHGQVFTDTAGVRNLVLNLVQQYRRRHICEVLEYMYDIWLDLMPQII